LNSWEFPEDLSDYLLQK